MVVHSLGGIKQVLSLTLYRCIKRSFEANKLVLWEDIENLKKDRNYEASVLDVTQLPANFRRISSKDTPLNCVTLSKEKLTHSFVD